MNLLCVMVGCGFGFSIFWLWKRVQLWHFLRSVGARPLSAADALQPDELACDAGP